jgi:hypothetical protein
VPFGTIAQSCMLIPRSVSIGVLDSLRRFLDQFNAHSFPLSDV